MKKALYCILVITITIGLAFYSDLAFAAGGAGGAGGGGGGHGTAGSSSGTGSGASMSTGGSSTGTGTGGFGTGIGGTGTGRGSSTQSQSPSMGTRRSGIPGSGFDQRDVGRSFEQRGGPASGFDQRQFGRSFDEGVPSGSEDRFNQNRQFEFNRQQGVDFDDRDMDRRDLDRGANRDDHFLNEEQRERLNEEQLERNISPEEQFEPRQFNEEFGEGVSPQNPDQFQQPFSNEGRTSDQFGNPLPFGQSIPGTRQDTVIRGRVVPPGGRHIDTQDFEADRFGTDSQMRFSDEDFNRDFDRRGSDRQFDRGF